MIRNFFEIAKKWIIDNWVFVVLIVLLLAYLIPMAMPDNHMEGGSAFPLLAARWWARDGFIKHYFLQLVNGYGKIVLYFDEPQLQEHAQGVISGGLIGHKLYYTHYPSLWIMPIALLMKLGIEKLFFLRLYSIILSILALVFFYLFAKAVSNKAIALVAVAYFAVSSIFLKFADQFGYALEDTWWFLILLLSFLTLEKLKTETLSPSKIKWRLAALWGIYFLLSLTSFDATVFVFTWLMGMSALYLYNSPYQRKIRIFIFLTALWALAPILGFTLQLIQSAAYLGWHNMLLDIYGTFTSVGSGTGMGLLVRIEGLIRPYFSITGIYNFYTAIGPFGIGKLKQSLIGPSIPTIFIILLLIPLIAVIVIKLKKQTNYYFPHPSVLTLLVLAQLSQILILPYTGYRDAMGRFTAPFLGIVIGTIVWMLFLAFSNKNSLILSNKIIFSVVALIIVSLFAIQIVVDATPRLWAPYATLGNDQIAFSKAMHNIAPGEKATFMINTADTQIPEAELKKRHTLYTPKQYMFDYYAVWEYYLDMPLLGFTGIDYLVRDLTFLEKRSEFPFTAIITSDDEKIINELYKNLADKKLPLSAVKILENRYFFTISPNKKN